jgi:TatD DNase family protein
MPEAERIRALGFYLGIGGVVTFKNGGLDKILTSVPAASLILETDAPYLAPHPYRGKRNESSYLVLVAEKLATIYDIPKEKIARITTENALKLFGTLNHPNG